MSKQKILLLEKEDSPWPSFLEEFFADTRSELEQYDQASDAGAFLSKYDCRVAFVQDRLMSPALIQKIKVQKQSQPDFRVFSIQMDHPPVQFSGYDAKFTEPLEFLDFQRKLMQHLPFPESINVLMIDDEPEVAVALIDFLRKQTNPKIELDLAMNGAEGLLRIEKKAPDVLILDVKMPVLNGIDTYAQLVKQKVNFPVIVHFDSVFGDETFELHKIGNPAIVEKGGNASGVFDMMALILKMYYFA